MRGRRITYSADELAFVRALSALPREVIVAEIAAVFGRTDLTVDHIKALCTRHWWCTRTAFSPAEDATIRAQYPDSQTATVAAHLGRTTASVYRRAHALGVSKSAAFLASAMSGRTRGGVGVATRFKKGQTPPNKGLRRPGWSPGRMKETQFGNKPVWNHQPIGATRIDSEGYAWTKVQDLPKVRTDVNWKTAHTLNWEAVHGPVPKGHVLKCLDGNRLNTAAENWECVPRGVLARLNGGRHKKRVSYDAAAPELKPTVMAVAQLEHEMGRRRRREKEQAA